MKTFKLTISSFSISWSHVPVLAREQQQLTFRNAARRHKLNTEVPQSPFKVLSTSITDREQMKINCVKPYFTALVSETPNWTNPSFSAAVVWTFWVVCSKSGLWAVLIKQEKAWAHKTMIRVWFNCISSRRSELKLFDSGVYLLTRSEPEQRINTEQQQTVLIKTRENTAVSQHRQDSFFW